MRPMPTYAFYVMLQKNERMKVIWTKREIDKLCAVQDSIHTSFYIIVMMEVSSFWTFLAERRGSLQWTCIATFSLSLSLSCFFFSRLCSRNQRR